MQFSCESCHAQLQIADEKVRGKRLVVRCKRCGAKIALADPLVSKTPPRVIAPPPPSAPPPASLAAAASLPDSDTESTRAMDSDVLEKALRALRADDVVQNGSPPTQRFATPPRAVPPDPAVWFAMLHGRQTGPLTRTDLELRADEGELGPRTYVWCEGMDSWQRAKDVLDLVALFPQPPGPTQPPVAAAHAQSQPSPSRTVVTTAAQTTATVPAAAISGGITKPHLHQNGETSEPAPAHAVAAVDPSKEATTQEKVATMLPRAFMFGSSAGGGQGPFVVFVALMALAVAAVALWVVLGAPAQRPAEPAHQATAFVGLTAEQVRRKLDENKPALQECVDDARRRDPTLQVGTIHVATTIAPSGQVTEARIDQPSVDESPLGACLKRATRKIVFPQFSGAAFDVDIPISVGAAR
jgi:predicted Zn finger-like uncharacterized protein